MFSWCRSRLTFANVVSLMALFVALSTGGAYATHLVVDSSDVVDNSLTGTDVRGKPRTNTAAAVNGSLTTDDIAGQQAHPGTKTPFVDGTLTQWDIKNGSIAGADIASNAISGAKVANNTLNGTDVADESLTGADIDEPSLGQVSSAVLGGIGRWSSSGVECDPDEAWFLTCAFTTINLPAQSRVLVIGTIKAQPEPGGSAATGQCRLATSLGAIFGTTSGITVHSSPSGFLPLIAITQPVGPGPVDFGIECNELHLDLEYFDARTTAVALSPN
jgi:hypothetical protein